MSTSARDNIEKSLDVLTQAVGKENTDDSLLAAITLYRDLGEVAKVLNMTIPPDFFQVKYEALSALTEASRKDWKAAESHASQIEQYWNQLRLQAGNQDSKLVERTEFSLHDIRQAIKSQSLEMAVMKGTVLVNNLKELEDAFTRPSSNQSQGGAGQNGQNQGQGGSQSGQNQGGSQQGGQGQQAGSQ